jgi:integrase
VSVAQGENGRRRKQFYGKTQADVLHKVNKARHELDQGLPITGDGQTVQQFLEHWLENCARQRLRPRTFAGYKYHVEKKLVPALGATKLSALSGQQVQHMVNEHAKTLQPRTVRYVRAVLRSALNQAVKWNLVVRNVARLVDLPRMRKHYPRVLPPDEAKAFVKAASTNRLGALFSVALAVGLRLGEAEGLKWDDIDLESKKLHVRRALQRLPKEPGEKKSRVAFVEPKSEQSRRTVTLPQFAVDALKKHRVRQKEERLKAGKHWQEQGLVFATTVGTFVDERNLRREFQIVLDAAKLPHMRIHDLRHTCASLLLAQGVHIKVVQEILGHSHVSLTLDTYSHLIPGVEQQASEKMNALFVETAQEETQQESEPARGCQMAVKSPA